MFDRFTDRARKTMGLAWQRARRLGHDYIGTEHVLLGLIEEGGGVAADVLKNLHVDPQRIRKEVEGRITPGNVPDRKRQLPFTPRMKRALELALEEASHLGHDYIGTEHLLLGLVREEEGIAAQALDTLGVRLEKTRAAIRELLGVEPNIAAIRDRAPAPRGSGFFDRFTDRARKVLGLSRQEAQRFNHDYIGTEHILLGLLHEGSGVAADVLMNLDVDPKRIRLEIERLLSHGTTMVTTGQLPFTPGAKKVLELAHEEASNLGHDDTGTAHLLLGLIREEWGIAAQALLRLNVRVADARDEVIELIGAEPGRTVHETRVPEVSGPLADRARRVLRIAADEAARFRHREIGTEHLLLGLIGEVAPGVLSKILLRRLRMDTERLMTPGTEPVADGPPGFTPAARKAIELALQTTHLARGGAGPEDLLLGLIGEREGIAARVLADAGFTADDVLGLGFDQVAGWKVMSLAYGEARRLGHDCIGTEHLLLGLVAADGEGADLLRRLGVDAARVRAEVEKRVTPGSAAATSGQLPFTPAMKRVLELALEEATALGEIREGHILLGLLREGTATAAQVLAALGVKLDAVRRRVFLFPRGRSLGPPAPPE